VSSPPVPACPDLLGRAALAVRGLRALAAVLVLSLITVGLVAAPAHADRSTRAEARLLALMTSEREGAGAPPWSRLDDLTTAAARWSTTMAQEFGAQGGQRHNPRLTAEVCCYRRIAENVGWVSGADRDLDGAVDRLHAAFMGSAGHRGNVLAGAHTQVGVGAELHPSGNLYVTVVFREPDGSAPSGSSSTASSGSGGGGGDSSGSGSASTEPSPRPASNETAARTDGDAGTDGDARSDREADAGTTATASPAARAAAESAPAQPPAEPAAPARDPDELRRLARWALAEHDRHLEEEVLAELEALVGRLGAHALRIVETLRWAVGLPRDGGGGTDEATATPAAVRARGS
jgi:uncharacterized protein YkwD